MVFLPVPAALQGYASRRNSIRGQAMWGKTGYEEKMDHAQKVHNEAQRMHEAALKKEQEADNKAGTFGDGAVAHGTEEYELNNLLGEATMMHGQSARKHEEAVQYLRDAEQELRQERAALLAKDRELAKAESALADKKRRIG